MVCLQVNLQARFLLDFFQIMVMPNELGKKLIQQESDATYGMEKSPENYRRLHILISIQRGIE